MSLRTHLAVACVALPAMVGGIIFFEDREPAVPTNASPRPAVASVVASGASSPTIEVQHPTAAIELSTRDDTATIAYVAMRDDIDPKPRLQLIEAWARAAPPAAALDLLGQAMVDPDESVRTRAQELFDRRLQRR